MLERKALWGHNQQEVCTQMSVTFMAWATDSVCTSVFNKWLTPPEMSVLRTSIEGVSPLTSEARNMLACE